MNNNDIRGKSRSISYIDAVFRLICGKGLTGNALVVVVGTVLPTIAKRHWNTEKPAPRLPFFSFWGLGAPTIWRPVLLKTS
jgi:hypothetical protein